MRFNQTGSAVAHQQCLENAIPPHSGKIIGVQLGCRDMLRQTGVVVTLDGEILQPSCTLVNEAERGFS